MDEQVSSVRLLYFHDCPNWRVARARLKEALARIGADPDAVVYKQVTTVEQAEALGFRGSPTILVDGTDPFADPDAPTGLTCRTRAKGGNGPDGATQAVLAGEARAGG